MAESHVVTGLVAKRAELAGRIEQCRLQWEQLLADLDHVDHAIKIFAPDYELMAIRPKRPRQRNRYFAPGECQRLVLEIFRDAGQPLTVLGLADELVRRKGLEANAALLDQMRKNAWGVVRRLADRGLVRELPGSGKPRRWQLS